MRELAIAISDGDIVAFNDWVDAVLKITKKSE